ncbi:hypothetical protein J5N97_020635 [Dioscorea zingiberensis]|uniref:Uncharacterized protein n=1 Tax=Dioscorea zingiberensis TaxID=325984 RepID=A0A9D5HDF0_9LILI|nr:hypothetical protein J5N97_020635 [Dioscorea zingiberensis]
MASSLSGRKVSSKRRSWLSVGSDDKCGCVVAKESSADEPVKLFLRPSAKEFLKHRFIKNAQKSPRLMGRIRERQKFHMKGIETLRNKNNSFDDGASTVRVTKDSTDEISKSRVKNRRKRLEWRHTLTAAPKLNKCEVGV